MFEDKEELTPEEMLRVLKGEDLCSSQWSEDHPEFTALRYKLAEDRLITIQPSWSNGDRVQKPFKLNGHKFNKGEPFFSAGAMRHHLNQ